MKLPGLNSCMEVLVGLTGREALFMLEAGGDQRRGEDRIMNKRNLVILVIVIAAAALAVSLIYRQAGPLPEDEGDQEIAMEEELETEIEPETEETEEMEAEDAEEVEKKVTALPDGPDREVVMEDLTIPWELVFLPEGGMLITERVGRLTYVSENGSRQAFSIEDVEHSGEGGLLGLALHPSFEENRFLYLYFTAQRNSGLENRVVRYQFAGGELEEDAVVMDGIPGARIHNGGRIAFGPDGFLYIAAGDAAVPALSQDLDSLAGKILRIRDDGTIPADNPFGTPVYSYGHRNPQGLAWDSRGNLWATEHGQRALDELNQIMPGRNYGWPVIEGSETAPGMETPAAHSGHDETWAPSGAAYYDGSIFFAGLRGAALYEAVLSAADVDDVKRHLQGEFGRLRTVVTGPDGYLYLLTNNRDGRGSPRPGDDKIIRINPRLFRPNEPHAS